MTAPITETWTGTNGAAWPDQWSTASAGTATIQSNQGRIVTPTGAFGATSIWLSGMTSSLNSDSVFTFTCPSATVEWYITAGLRTPSAASAASNAGFPNNGMVCQVGYTGSAWAL